MTKQLAIAARDQGAGIPEQGLDGVARRGRLPLVAAKRRRLQKRPSDLLLRRAMTIAVDRLQHPAVAEALLWREPGIWRDGATEKRGEQAMDRFQSGEAVAIEQDQRGDRRCLPSISDVFELEALPVAEIVGNEVRSRVGSSYQARGFAIRDKMGRGRNEQDDAVVVLEGPEHRRTGWRAERIDREIAGPTVPGFGPVAVAGQMRSASAPRNPGHSRHSGEAIPRRDPRRIKFRHSDRPPPSASWTHLVSS